MKILLLHPQDSPDEGPWASQTWDRIVDLGQAGPAAYERWSSQFRCPAGPMEFPNRSDFQYVYDLYVSGLGRLLDAEGLDWWDLNAILLYSEMATLSVLQRLNAGLKPDDELYITRPCFQAEALAIMRSEAPRLLGRGPSDQRGLQRYLRSARRFPLRQLVEIFWDKYDPAYVIRGRFTAKPEPLSKPAVLIPSAYTNVTRMGLAYAASLPEMNFLLVATRRSGCASAVPPNTAVSTLAAYSRRGSAGSAELHEILRTWRELRRELESLPGISVLGRLGFLDTFPGMIASGVAVRNAWREVFDSESITGLICADDTNFTTRIPLIMALRRGVPSFICHHGALDGKHLHRPDSEALILAKGKMEYDYLVRYCGVNAGRVEIGAPAQDPVALNGQIAPADSPASDIVFFSEPYEVRGGRPQELYRELLPPFAQLASLNARRFIIKLHPFESHAQRSRLVAECLSPELRAHVEVISGPLTEELLARTWFGVSVSSTVVVECALRGIPFFLCRWLEFSAYRYLDQFGRFGAGTVLESAAAIPGIPQVLQNYSVSADVKANLWQPIVPGRFEQLLAAEKRHGCAVSASPN